jgi:hypothetical protein
MYKTYYEPPPGVIRSTGEPAISRYWEADDGSGMWLNLTIGANYLPARSFKRSKTSARSSFGERQHRITKCERRALRVRLVWHMLTESVLLTLSRLAALTGGILISKFLAQRLPDLLRPLRATKTKATRGRRYGRHQGTDV